MYDTPKTPNTQKGESVLFMIDVMSRKPIYEQLITQMESFILSEILKSGEQVPSVRSLSVQLSVNPNTIQKAYSELDTRGIIHSVPGKGCYVSDGAKEKLVEQTKSKLPEFREMIEKLKMGGITQEEILKEVDSIYQGGKLND